MKRPLTALLFANHYWPNILSRDKTITMRQGLRDYEIGNKVMLCCHLINMVVMAEITNVWRGSFERVSINDIIKDGFRNHNEALNILRVYYPEMYMTSAVTVIHWGQLEGALA